MLLALDTATATASLALFDLAANRLLAEVTWQAQRRQTQDLMPVAQQLLAQIDQTPAAITALAVTTGPGSFTGVRIGISTVKGLALGLPTPPKVIGIPTLNVSAAPWLPLVNPALVNLASMNPASSPAPVLYALLLAGRGRFNWANFAGRPPNQHLTAADHRNGSLAELVEELRSQANRPVWLIGETSAELISALAGLDHVRVVAEAFVWRRAGWLAQLAAQALAAGAADDVRTLQPIYLRAP